VRQLTSPEEIRDIISERSAAEGWRPGALDHISFFAADNTGFFVGELDGKPISSMSVVKYSSNFAFLGEYIVERSYRGMGYGVKTWEGAMASIDETYNYGGDAVVERVATYEQVGLKPYWSQQRYEFVAKEARRAWDSVKYFEQALKISPLSKPMFSSVFQYDSAVHVFPRHSFLEKWVFAPNCFSSVATDSDGKMVGYGVVRTTLREGDGWRIGPLFADISLIARGLYRDLCQKVAAEDPEGIIAVDVPYGNGFDPDTLTLVSELRGKPCFKCARIYKSGIPGGMPLQKIFGITSLDLG
jgi:hypothetical protein